MQEDPGMRKWGHERQLCGCHLRPVTCAWAVGQIKLIFMRINIALYEGLYDKLILSLITICWIYALQIFIVLDIEDMHAVLMIFKKKITEGTFICSQSAEVGSVFLIIIFTQDVQRT